MLVCIEHNEGAKVDTMLHLGVGRISHGAAEPAQRIGRA